MQVWELLEAPLDNAAKLRHSLFVLLVDSETNRSRFNLGGTEKKNRKEAEK